MNGSLLLKLGLNLIMFILAASPLHQALKILSPVSQKRLSQSAIATPGLSFDHNAVNVLKTCQYQFDHYLSKQKDVFIWHDAVNNCFSIHVYTVVTI